MEKWLRTTLSQCLDCLVTDEMMTTIMKITNDQEFDNYFGNLLSEDNEDHKLFLINCRRMLLSGKQPRSTTKPIKQTPSSQQQQQSKSGSGGGSGGAAKKQSGKFVNLYASDGKVIGDTILLKGRRRCDCQAAQHNLINNCLKCGRIVCVQEGSGPCLYCGEAVYTADEELLQAKSASKQTKGQKKGGGSSKPTNTTTTKENREVVALEKAIEHRDRLLEFDRNSEKRTTVIDDELDYFQENSVWLTDAEREKFERLKSEMHELKHGSRMKRKIKVDFAGRQLPEEFPITKEYEQQVLQELAATSSSSGSGKPVTSSVASMQLAPNLEVSQAPRYKAPQANKKDALAPPIHDGLERVYNRVQDKELLEMQDMRQCLSMHQPWASLLIAGIKRHEGRVWYTEHRGRLWIASTAKEPHAEDIAELEQFYRDFYNEKDLEFPQRYPTSSLLGCVHVDSCLPQEEYRERFPKGESDSPYVLVCTNPEQLPLLLPVQGEHKIYELPLKTHNAACKTLMRARVAHG